MSHQFTHLFFVRADNENGQNLDLLVWAKSREEAKTLWAEYYTQVDDVECKIGQVPGVQGYAPSRVIGWGLISMVLT